MEKLEGQYRTKKSRIRLMPILIDKFFEINLK